MPFKVWGVGEEVLAADFNDYVQEQVIAVFPNAAARDAAILAPNVGQQAWLTDVGRYTYYNGTAWAYVVPAQATGSVAVSFTAATASNVVTVTFPTGRFAVAPKVFMNAQTTGAFWGLASTITATNFQARGLSQTAVTTGLTLDWYATAAT